MSYPGDIADWTADRSTSRRYAIWKLSQTDAFSGGSLVFGLAGADGPSALVAVARLPGSTRQPYSARLVLRDQSLAPEPFINTIQADERPRAARAAHAAAIGDAHVPGRGAQRRRTRRCCRPAHARASAFRFPKAAATALSALDPREAVAVDFLFASRERPRAGAHGLRRGGRFRRRPRVPDRRSALRLEGDDLRAAPEGGGSPDAVGRRGRRSAPAAGPTPPCPRPAGSRSTSRRRAARRRRAPATGQAPCPSTAGSASPACS